MRKILPHRRLGLRRRILAVPSVPFAPYYFLLLLILLPMLVGCGSKESKEVDTTELRVQCEKESGFSGPAQVVPETGLVFVWRADEAMVAECQDGKLVGILESGDHPGDAP